MLETEKRNPYSMHIDTATTEEMLELFQRENLNAVNAVGKALPEIGRAVDAVAERLSRGGRLFYVGAGTSGRLGVLDASECPPTFGVSPETVVGVIAGGERCLTRAAEGQEDDAGAGRRDLEARGVCAGDAVVGISSSGGAAYVVGALEYAGEVGAVSIALSSNYDTPAGRAADISIVTDTGPEIITGSTRLKSGTAQKLVLNMLSTCGMIKTGKVYENMMINLRPSNRKLRERVIRIVTEIRGCDAVTAVDLLEKADWDIRRAVSL